jgi:heme/copper-type cytochrome/quinol oxidase subunit 2
VQVFLAISFVVFLLLPVLICLVLFVWAAKKDGEEDKAVRKRLGARGRT